MGSDPGANLAYGYDLGSTDEWLLAEATGEWGELVLPWYDETIDDENESEDDEEDTGFAAALMNRLYAAIPDPPPADHNYGRANAAAAHWGVKLVSAGSLTEGSTGEVLIAVGSDEGRHRSVEWSETMPLDLDELAALPAANGWDAKLAAAITALGITPVRDVSEPGTPRDERKKAPVGPRWLVFPTYG